MLVTASTAETVLECVADRAARALCSVDDGSCSGLRSCCGGVRSLLAGRARSVVGVAGGAGHLLAGVARGLLRVMCGVARALLDATRGVGPSPARLRAGVVELCLGVAGRFASAAACTSMRSQPPPAARPSDVHAERISYDRHLSCRQTYHF